MPKSTYTLFLAKPDVVELNDMLSDRAREQLAAESTESVQIDDFGDEAVLHVFSNVDYVPGWLRRLRREFDIGGGFRSTSACAVLALRTNQRIFATTFAHAWLYLDQHNIEGDFGLRVAINALDDQQLKRLERANLADAIRDVSHSAFSRDLKSFELEEALDLVRKISGKVHTGIGAEQLTGGQSLKITGDIQIDDLPDIAEQALELFSSELYKETLFSIIDVVTPIIDRRTIDTLDKLAVESIKNDENEFELGVPTTSEEETVYYGFSGIGFRGKYADLLLRNYITALGDKLDELTIDAIKTRHKIDAKFDDEAHPDQSWSIRRGLVGSLVWEEGRYAINDGEWYRIDDAFKESIELAFQSLIRDWDGVIPRPFAKLIGEKGKAKYESEDSYNAAIATELNFLCLDRKLILAAGAGSGFEACDLLDVDRKRLIHVKKSSRRSSVLSHLFKQGSNSAKNLVSFPEAAGNLARKVEELYGAESVARFREIELDKSKKWTIEYWIADAPRENGDFNIPFFSKITLRDEERSMRAMGYDVALRFIRLPDPIQ